MEKLAAVPKPEKPVITGNFTKAQCKHMCCGVPMVQQTIEFSCGKCGKMEKDVDVLVKRHGPSVHPIQVNLGGKQKILSGPYQGGANKSKVRNQIGKMVREKMGEILIPDSILNNIERDYNQIQSTNEYRTSQKGEVIAYLIYYHMAMAKMYIRRQDIAVRMGLQAKSFTDGESTVHDYYIREGMAEDDVDKNALMNLSMDFANRFGITDDQSLDLIAKISEVILRECIIESVSIGTRACCVVCIFLAIQGTDVNFREVEKHTQCKKNTIFKAFLELGGYYDDFKFLGEDVEDKMETFRTTVLKIKKRKLDDQERSA